MLGYVCTLEGRTLKMSGGTMHMRSIGGGFVPKVLV